MAAAIAVVYPHMNSIGGDGFWLIARAASRRVGPVRYIEACGPAGAQAPRSSATATRATTRSRRAGPMRRSRCRAAVDGWRAGARAVAGARRPAAARPTCSSPRSGSRARAIPCPRSEAPDAPHERDALRRGARVSRRPSCVDGKLPPAGTLRRQPRARRDPGAARPCRACATSTAATSPARSPPIWTAIGAPRDADRPAAATRRNGASRCRCGSPDCTHLQRAAADPGPRVAAHPRHVRAARRARVRTASATSTG